MTPTPTPTDALIEAAERRANSDAHCGLVADAIMVHSLIAALRAERERAYVQNADAAGWLRASEIERKRADAAEARAAKLEAAMQGLVTKWRERTAQVTEAAEACLDGVACDHERRDELYAEASGISHCAEELEAALTPPPTTGEKETGTSGTEGT